MPLTFLTTHGAATRDQIKLHVRRFFVFNEVRFSCAVSLKRTQTLLETISLSHAKFANPRPSRFGYLVHISVCLINGCGAARLVCSGPAMTLRSSLFECQLLDRKSSRIARTRVAARALTGGD